MKIVYISVYPPPGEKNHPDLSGVAAYQKNLVNHISHLEQVEVVVLAQKIKGHPREYKENNVRIIRCFDRNFKYIFQILKEVKRLHPDIIHIQQEIYLYGDIVTAYSLQWLIFALRRYKTVVTLHGVLSLKKINKGFIKENNSLLPKWLIQTALKIIYKPICRYATKIIVHEEYFKRLIVEEYQGKNGKISVIPHGVEDFRTIEKSEACKKLQIDAKKDICLFMGFAASYKGLDLLIEGFSKYTRVNKNAYLIIGAGEHPKLKKNKKYVQEYQKLQDKAKALIPENQYRWVGFISERDISVFYSASDISLYPYTVSMSSSGPMAIAIGHTKPFLVSSAFSDIFSKEEIIFERTPEKLAERLSLFFQNKDVYQNYVSLLKQQRSWQKVAETTFSLYKAL